MDIGAYGPIAGYLASLPVVAIGFMLSRRALEPNALLDSGLVAFGQPLTLRIVHGALVHLHLGVPSFQLGILHPVLIAGWVGLFITSLNLIPGGQLDGGHILYSLSPRIHKITTWMLPFALLICGLFFWVGRILWAALLLIPAMRHPHVPAYLPLDSKRQLLAWASLAIFLLTFSIEPIVGNALLRYLRR